MEDKLNDTIIKTKEEIKNDIEFLKATIENLEVQISKNDINTAMYFSETVKKYADSINNNILILNAINKLK